MEDSKMSECAGNDESTSKENEVVISEINSANEKLSPNLEKQDSSSKNLNSISSSGDESVSQHTFKKPDFLIAHRKGKHPSKVATSSDPYHSIIPAEWILEKSENVQRKSEGSEQTESKEKDPEVKVSSPKENEKNIEEDEQTQKDELIKEETDKEIQLEKEKQLKLEKQKQMRIEKEKQIPLSYKEPPWSGKPEKEYKVEVLKSGVILEIIDLSEKCFYVVGRLPICDISLAHPTISRYHAVFQYRSESDEKNEKGLYLYDLGSTHGTFWNGNRIRPNMYVRIRGGHMIRFGNSQRKFIMQTPPEEEEEESELTVTELKEKRKLELEERTRMEIERQKEEELAEKLRLEKEESEGIDWGMSEDADEDTDLTENPYAQTNNEELFLEDPKKTLRGWFEREGHELQYQAEEKSIGRFICWVDLPIEDYVGRSIRAEATVKGKKKEAVIQCALEACRILDRHGILRQAVHEGRKKKARNWEAEDFYDSDEDNFLDRTGTVEKKREQRMRAAGKLNAKAETYKSLTTKHAEIAKEIKDIESRLQKSQKSLDTEESGSTDDALDAFMSQLKSTTILNKSDITKYKMDLQKLRKEEEQLLKLIEISKPANLPALKPQFSNFETIGSKRKSSNKSFKNKKAVKESENTETNEQTETNPGEKSDRDTKESFENEILNKKDSGEKLNNSDSDDVSEPKVKIMKKSEKSSENNDKVITDESIRTDVCERMEEEEEKNQNDSKEKNEDDEALKKKKRNLKRIQQRALKAEKEKIKSYEDEQFNDDYCTWVPPEGQSGDGKTALNDKFGY